MFEILKQEIEQLKKQHTEVHSRLKEIETYLSSFQEWSTTERTEIHSRLEDLEAYVNILKEWASKD